MSDLNLGICIPTINREDLLRENVAALLRQAAEFSRLLIVDNGDQDLEFGHEKVEVFLPGRNLGVAASWNFGLHELFANPSTTHVLVLNDDICLREGSLRNFKEVLRQHPDRWFFTGTYEWSAWAMAREGRDRILEADGYVFDERFFPAYFEDNDFDRRFSGRFPDRRLPDIDALAPLVSRHSSSVERDPSLNARFGDNRDYYVRKWGGAPGEETRAPDEALTIDFCYRSCCQIPSDINEHLPSLKELAEDCSHVTELGVRTVVSTWAFMAANPARLVSYDIHWHPNIALASDLASGAGIRFEFLEKDVLQADLEPTDLLFIDTKHNYDQLRRELEIHSRRVAKYIALHDTVTFGHKDEYDDGTVIAKKGLVPAIVEFLDSAEGAGWRHFGTDIANNGLTVLARRGSTPTLAQK